MKDGELLAAVEEEKVARQFRPGALPETAIAATLQIAKLSASDVNCVALARPFEQTIHLTLRSQFPNAQVVMVEHHTAHAASAYYPSPFEEATVLTLDRDGDFRSAARWRASGNQLQLEKDVYYPDSLGDLYGRVTELLGFNAGADEHKVQWLSTADSGEEFLPLFEEILGGSAWPCLNRSYFDSDRLSQRRLQRQVLLEGRPRRRRGHPAKKEGRARCRIAARDRARRAAHGRIGRTVMRGGRPRIEFAANQLARTIQASVRAARRRKRGHGARSRAVCLERRFRPDQTCLAQRSVPRAQL